MVYSCCYVYKHDGIHQGRYPESPPGAGKRGLYTAESHTVCLGYYLWCFHAKFIISLDGFYETSKLGQGITSFRQRDQYNMPMNTTYVHGDWIGLHMYIIKTSSPILNKQSISSRFPHFMQRNDEPIIQQ